MKELDYIPSTFKETRDFFNIVQSLIFWLSIAESTWSLFTVSRGSPRVLRGCLSWKVRSENLSRISTMSAPTKRERTQISAYQGYVEGERGIMIIFFFIYFVAVLIVHLVLFEWPHSQSTDGAPMIVAETCPVWRRIGSRARRCSSLLLVFLIPLSCSNTEEQDAKGLGKAITRKGFPAPRDHE